MSNAIYAWQVYSIGLFYKILMRVLFEGGLYEKF